jgi:hypothetical protein
VCRALKYVSALVAVSLLTMAQTQAVATVTSDSPFELRGATVTPGQGVPSWPVVPGDAIQAGKTPLTLTFSDGSKIVLAPDASAQVGLSGQTPVFQLLSGTAQYSLKKRSSVKVVEHNTVVVPTNTGMGLWTTGHMLVIAGTAAGATALGLGVAAASSSSPTQCKSSNGNGNGNGGVGNGNGNGNKCP